MLIGGEFSREQVFYATTGGILVCIFNVKTVILPLIVGSNALTRFIFYWKSFMKKLYSAALCISTLFCSFAYSAFSVAETSPQAPALIAKPEAVEFNAEHLVRAISSITGLKVSKALKTPMAGLAEVHTEQGLFYSSYDGKYFIQGKLFELGENVANLTEESLAGMRIDGFKKYENDMIVFAAEKEQHVITVFTDYTCSFCRKMHQKIDEYNDLGITVRYLPYPRFGIYDREIPGEYSENFNKLRSIWCHENPNMAMTKAKASNGKNVAQRICNKPIEDTFNFARQVGVNSTPAIVFDNGFLMPGFREPADLKAILDTM